MKEKKFKLQEAELREKDILIQDNLIKFSTFLQQQEMRKKKDIETTKAEERVSQIISQNLTPFFYPIQKIQEYNQSIADKLQLLKVYKQKAEKIESKVRSMKKFEMFLEEVKDGNSDEFAELQDILSRYK